MILELTLITPRWLLYHYFQHYPCYISLGFKYPWRWCFSNCHLSPVISSLPNTIQPWSHSYSLLWSFISSYHFLKHHLLHQLNYQHSTVYQNSWNVKLFLNHCTQISKPFTLLIKNLTIAFLNFLLFLTNSPLFLVWTLWGIIRRIIKVAFLHWFFYTLNWILLQHSENPECYQLLLEEGINQLIMSTTGIGSFPFQNVPILIPYVSVWEC